MKTTNWLTGSEYQSVTTLKYQDIIILSMDVIVLRKCLPNIATRKNYSTQSILISDTLSKYVLPRAKVFRSKEC